MPGPADETWSLRPKLPRLDLSKASAARVYDYALGGNHNTAADRAVADGLQRIEPHGPYIARANRGMLHRAVRFLVHQGVDQFLDLGSGLPTAGNVHEVAHQLNPATRVVYVDNELVAFSDTKRMLAEVPRADIVNADIREPEEVLAAPETQRLLDFSRPVGLLLVAVLHYVGAEVDEVLAGYRRVLAPGSHVVISHATADEREQDAAKVQEIFDNAVAEPLTMRTRAEVERLFTGLRMVEPGVVWTASWRPDAGAHAPWPPERSACWAGVAVLD